MEDRLFKIESELRTIQERNARVESDKAWEQSPVRILSILFATYLIATTALITIGNDHPLRNALIPVLGYFLSVQSLPFLKRYWIRHRTEKNIS